MGNKESLTLFKQTIKISKEDMEALIPCDALPSCLIDSNVNLR
jgi:hypothetical protein